MPRGPQQYRAAVDPYTCIPSTNLQLWSSSPLLSLPHLGAPHPNHTSAHLTLSGLDRFRKAEQDLLCELNSADVESQASGAHGLWELSVRREHKRVSI